MGIQITDDMIFNSNYIIGTLLYDDDCVDASIQDNRKNRRRRRDDAFQLCKLNVSRNF